MNELDAIKKHIAEGESETMEFKKSTGQLSRAAETLCAFLNGKGGSVYFGVSPDGQLTGQEVSDSTLRDIAAVLEKFEPKAPISQEIIPFDQRKNILVLSAPAIPETGPFTFKGRAYERVGSTTSPMKQSRYETLLLQKNHSRKRWENTYAEWNDTNLLDEEEILRTVRLGTEAGRMPESTGKNIVDILERLGLRVNGSLLNAAFVLFGKKFMPYYPQCQLRLARFKGRDKSEFLDHKQIRGHAFYLLDEAMTFFHRHLAISGKFEENRMERIDKPGLPTLALREALVNAICHRDYSLPGGAVSVAIYDDRAEIWSDGTLPFGLKPEDLSREHTSKPRNPIITDVFFRRGLIEQWGRGTQKIIELCENSGAFTPEFNELAGALRVRFPLHEEITPQVSPQDTPQVTPQVTPQDNTYENTQDNTYENTQDSTQDNTQDSTQDNTQDSTQDSTYDITQIKPEIKRLLTNLYGNMSRNDLLNAFNFKSTKNLRKRYLVPALEQGFIEMTIPEKPNSRNQRYRLTEKGRVVQKQLEKK